MPRSTAHCFIGFTLQVMLTSMFDSFMAVTPSTCGFSSVRSGCWRAYSLTARSIKSNTLAVSAS